MGRMSQEWYYQDGPVIFRVNAMSLADAPHMEAIYDKYLEA
jgi:hypothetical protein